MLYIVSKISGAKIDKAGKPCEEAVKMSLLHTKHVFLNSPAWEKVKETWYSDPNNYHHRNEELEINGSKRLAAVCDYIKDEWVVEFEDLSELNAFVSKYEKVTIEPRPDIPEYYQIICESCPDMTR